MSPSISVLITYYNERELLTECLNSLKVQTRLPDEIIIYDDASIYPAQDYIPKDLKVCVIRGLVNIGPARGRNELIRCATSEFIHFHDADDLFEPHWCELVSLALQDTMLDVVFTEVRSIVNQQVCNDKVLGLSKLKKDPDLLRFSLNYFLLLPSGTYRRTIVCEIHGYREELWQAEDFDFHIRLAHRGVTYGIIDQPLVVIRLREASRSNREKKQVWLSALQVVRFQIQELPVSYHQDLAEMACVIGTQLFHLGIYDQAHQAFQLAYQLGPPTFHKRRRSYRLLAKWVGPEITEWLSRFYRWVLPVNVRASVVNQGW